MAKRQQRYRGHYCWRCERGRPNKQFSGKGHARHLCNAGTRLGAEDLAYRQALRHLERDMGMSIPIPPKHRASFNRFSTHQDPRIRAVARGEMEERDTQTRAASSKPLCPRGVDLGGMGLRVVPVAEHSGQFLALQPDHDRAVVGDTAGMVNFPRQKEGDVAWPLDPTL
jgi:hypothetical protein